MKYVSHKKTSITRFHIYEVSKVVNRNSRNRKNGLLGTEQRGERGIVYGYDVSDWQDEKALEICCTTMDK